ncbi:hypothetical protein diail_6019 [Diaporthe ilicicola]|nr:hypothetical protein diail_6019 [Diaporthe ilicicola]
MACSDSDDSYDGGPAPNPNTNSRKRMSLRDSSRIIRPARYRDDLEPIDPGRPIFVHEDPVFNMDRGRFVQWRTLELNEPSPGEAQYELWKSQGEPRDAFGNPDTSSLSQPQIAESRGPTVAHLRLQAPAVRPDLSQPIVDTTQPRDAYDEAYERNLASFEDSDDEDDTLVMHPPLSSEYRDWSSLSDKVKWAIIYDLAYDHDGGITAAANLLGLTLPDVLEFVNIYLREKTLWETGSYPDEATHSAQDLFHHDYVQDEADQPMPEAQGEQSISNHEVPQRTLGDDTFQMIADGKIDLPVIEEEVDGMWNEPEVELFFEPEVGRASTTQGAQAVSDKGIAPPSTETVVDQPSIAENEIQSESRAPPALVELITDSFSRVDIASGRSFLTFLGLKEYANRFGLWFGRGADFREIPGIFDENNNFIFSTEGVEEALYSGNEAVWTGPPLPPLDQGPAQREWLMEALPTDSAQDQGLVDPEFQEFHAFAERINGRRISLNNTNENGFDYVCEGASAGLRYDDEFDRTGSNDDIFAFLNLSDDGPLGSNISQQNDNLHRAEENMRMRGSTGDFSGNGARLFNNGSAMQLCPAMPRFDNGIAPRLLERSHIDINEGLTSCKPIPPPFPPPCAQSDEDTGQATVEAAPTPDLARQNHSVASRDQAMTESEIRDAGVTTGEAVVHDAQSNTPIADAAKFSENGIEVESFPKCFTCFTGRKTCDGGRPCGSCTSNSRVCKDVTKEALDKEPEKAQRVLKKKERLDRMAALTGERSTVLATASTPNVTVSAPANPAASEARQKRPAVTADPSTDEEDSGSDGLPPEKEDPGDDDYGDGPKKKRAKKVVPTAGKKRSAGQAKQGVPATSTPTKKRAPARNKNSTPTARHNESAVVGTSAATRRPNESASAGNTTMNTPQQTAAATPNLAERSVVGRRLAPPHPSSGAGDSRYLDASFAPLHMPAGTPTNRPDVSGMPMGHMSGFVPGAAFRNSPSQRAPGSQFESSRPIPPRPQTVPADNDHPRGTGLNNSPETQRAQHRMFPMTAGTMPLMPPIANPQPGLSSSHGPRKNSSTSQSSGSGSTVSMDFSHMPFTPGRGSPAQSARDGVDRQSMSASPPNISPGTAPGRSAIAPRRPQFVSRYGLHPNVPSPMMGMGPQFPMAYGPVSSYAASQQQPPMPYPTPVPQQIPIHSRPSAVVQHARGEMAWPRSQRVGASPTHRRPNTASPQPAMRRAEAPTTPGQQPAGTGSRASDSPIAPPKEAASWKDLAIHQWSTDAQGNLPDTASASVRPVFGGDGPIDVSFSQFTRARERIDPQLQQTAMETARKMNKSPTRTNEKKSSTSTTEKKR